MRPITCCDDAIDLAGQIKEPKLARLYAYWRQRRGTRRFPRRRDIDPLDFPYLLGNVMLVDVLDDPRRFAVRLHGTEMALRARYDLTGKLIDELPDTAYRAYVIERCTSVVDLGAACHVRNIRMIEGYKRGYEALWLPLSDDDTAVTMLLCALVYDPPTGPSPAQAA